MTSTFTDISPELAASYDPSVMRDEVLRRMEVYVLEVLHHIFFSAAASTSSTGAAHGEQSGGACAATSHAARALDAADDIDAGARHALNERAPRRVGGKRHQRGDSTRASPPSCASVSGPRCTPEHASPPVAPARSADARRVPLRTLHTVRHHLLVLAVLFGNVRSATVATLRDVYYHLVRHVPAQAVVNRTVLQLARVLRVPRQLLGVTAGVRGFVAGCVSYRGVRLMGDGEELGGSAGWGGSGGGGFAEGMPLPLLDEDLAVTLCAPASDATVGDAATPTGAWDRSEDGNRNGNSGGHNHSTAARVTRRAPPTGFQVCPNVCAILVVEKHAVFTQLLREGLPRLLPCVLLTSQGFPTHAARRLASRLHAALPRAALVGLADYNPHGLAILAAYRWAAPTAGPTQLSPSTIEVASLAPHTAYAEVRHYALPALRWLGVRGVHVAQLRGNRNTPHAGPHSAHPHPPSPPMPVSSAGAEALASPLQPFTHRDTVVLRNLVGRLEADLAASSSPSTAARRAEQASVRAWVAEAQEMQRLQIKCELEVLYTSPYGTRFVAAVSDAGVGVDRQDGDYRLPRRQFAEWVKEQLLRRAYC